MPRIFKGTETLLKLFVPRVDEGNLETLKIGLFTDDTNNAAEFYGDNMSIDGDTVYLKVNAWSFDNMNDGVLNYIAEIEIGEEIIITERQSNYYLKTPNQYVPVGPDLSDYYTKPEIDEMLEDIEVDVDLTGYATEQWVEDKTYATEQYVNDAIANIDIPEGGSGEQEVYIEELAEQITPEQFYRIYELSQSGKIVLAKYDGGIYPISSLEWVNINIKYIGFFQTKGNYITYIYYSESNSGNSTIDKIEIVDAGKVYNRISLNNGRLSKFVWDDFYGSLIPVLSDNDQLVPLNLDKKNQIASAIIGDKLYKWDFVNGETDDGYNYSPEIIPLTGGGSGDGSSAIIVDGSNYYTINPSQFEDAYNNNIPAFYKDTESFFPVIITKGKSEKFEAYCLLENKQLVRWKWSSGVDSTSAVIEDIVDNNSVKYVSITKFNKLLYADVEDAYTNGKILYVRLRTTTSKPHKYTTIPFSIIRDEGNLNYQIFGVYSYNPFSIISATIADGEANFSDYTITEVSGGEGGGGTILPTDNISCNSINANSVEFNYATFNGEIYLNGGQGYSPMVDTANGIETAYKTSRTMVNDTWVDNIHIGNRYDGNNRINFTTTYYNVPENTTDSEKIVASIDAEGNFYEGETKLSDKYALKSEIKSPLQRLSGESLNGEEVYNLWQNNIPIWMDYLGYDRDNGAIYTAYAPLHIYKPLANGTELRVYMWITPNIYVEWNLDINDNDNVHGIITDKE